MNRDQALRLCADLPGSVLDHPFGDGTGVFKVGGKMFALVSLDGEPGSINLKVDPDEGVELRRQHSGIVPGYHMNKKHWITITLDDSVPHDLVVDLIEGSHALILSALPARTRPPNL